MIIMKGETVAASWSAVTVTKEPDQKYISRTEGLGLVTLDFREGADLMFPYHHLQI